MFYQDLAQGKSGVFIQEFAQGIVLRHCFKTPFQSAVLRHCQGRHQLLVKRLND
ncbi:hypothetical protein AO371_0154 [Moraxella catarrhalis]|uniref:hypothetical protein n=1 Tax=Moraxella catarrhalis TaxID=480 RepID=UPI0007F3EF33|nr:hypothetical protein [Moraxella catarrhalis]OAV26407.1 hypothetical protein AO371_0154 [Moraxella catarrhalis]